MRAMNKTVIKRVLELAIFSQLLPTHNQFLAQYNTAKSITPSINAAILLANASNPANTKSPPINEDPRYPAGNVNCGIPPRMRVAPP